MEEVLRSLPLSPPSVSVAATKPVFKEPLYSGLRPVEWGVQGGARESPDRPPGGCLSL